MHRYLYVLLFVVGIIGFYSVAFADVCNITVKCVCETNSVRVVPCPADFVNEAIDCTKEGIPQGSCAVDCGQGVAAFCAEIPIQCKKNEKKNCMVTLPVEVHSGCPFDETNCSGQCVDISNDEANCGTCGNSCDTGEECVSGVCTQPSCPPNLVFCSGAGCVDLSSDPNNCGGCGQACNVDDSCVSGLCVANCLPDQALCFDQCVEILTDPNNCGGCGIACAAGEACVFGACKKSDGHPCTAGSECASGNCVDGVCCNSPCNVTCESCSLSGSQGTCSIDPTCCSNPDLNFCPGAGCVDLSSDENNCGGCGNECSAISICTSGTCIP